MPDRKALLMLLIREEELTSVHWIKRRKIISTKTGLPLVKNNDCFLFYFSHFLTLLNTDSDEEDSASASNTQKEKPASDTQKEQPKPHLSNGVAASPTSSRYRIVPQWIFIQCVYATSMFQWIYCLLLLLTL